jgi:hypothetical protein
MNVKSLAIFAGVIAFCFGLGFSMVSEAKEKKRAPKFQDVSFDGDQVDGVTRSPEGFYITQKKAVDFLPLYRVRETFDSNIRESVEYLR